MKKKVLKIIALVVAVALIAGVGFFANALVGNPISKWIATNTAKEYLADEYSDKNFEIDRVTYSFKDSKYHAFIKSPSSIDSEFTLLIDMWGELRADYYEDRVLSGRNTADRIDREYRAKVDAVLDSQTFPYIEHIGYGDIAFIEREFLNNSDVPEYAIVTEDLTLDAFYDIDELGAKAGRLTIYLDDETVSYERAAEVILDIRKIFDAAGVKFYTLDFVLTYPKNEDSTKKEGRVEVMEFLYTDIYEEGMVERVKASNDAANAYYNEQDAEKFKEKIEEQK